MPAGARTTKTYRVDVTTTAPCTAKTAKVCVTASAGTRKGPPSSAPMVSWLMPEGRGNARAS